MVDKSPLILVDYSLTAGAILESFPKLSIVVPSSANKIPTD